MKISRTCHALEPLSFDTPFLFTIDRYWTGYLGEFCDASAWTVSYFCISCSTKLRANSLIHTRASGEVEITRELGGGGNPLGYALFDTTLGRYWAGYLAMSWVYCGRTRLRFRARIWRFGGSDVLTAMAPTLHISSPHPCYFPLDSLKSPSHTRAHTTPLLPAMAPSG